METIQSTNGPLGSETPTAQKNIKLQVQNTINALSITTPLGVNALESGEIPEN
jgi:hypothetical protein